MAVAGDDGHFEFPAVQSGDWRTAALFDLRGDAGGGIYYSRGTASALVNKDDIDDLRVHVAKPFNLTGTIEWNDQVPGPRFRPSVTLVNADSTEFRVLGMVESGELSFPNILPGRYKAVVKPGLAARIFLGESEVTGQTFPLTARGPRLRVVLKTGSGTVRGTVEKGDGATVVLVPRGVLERVEAVGFGQTIVCGAGGSFELSEVSPGDYYIAAFDHGGMAPSAAMIDLVTSRGTSVKVEEHSTGNVTLSVIPAPR
jgi:hypothetical protein